MESHGVLGTAFKCSERDETWLKLFLLLNADDTVNFSDDQYDFQNSLDIFNDYCRQSKLEVNKNKTKNISI